MFYDSFGVIMIDYLVYRDKLEKLLPCDRDLYNQYNISLVCVLRENKTTYYRLGILKQNGISFEYVMTFSEAELNQFIESFPEHERIFAGV